MQMTGSGVWRTYGAWGLGLGTLSQPLQAGLKLCRTSGAREEEDGAVHAWAQCAPVCTRALMMVVLREPTPSPEFSTEKAAARCNFFLALPGVANVECALGLGGFLGAAPIYSNRVAGARRHKPARRGGGRSL